MRLRTWTRRTSRAALAASYLIALVGPVHPAAADGWTIDVSADDPFVDWDVTLDGVTLLHVIASSGVDCPLDHTTTPDPYLLLLDSTGATYAADDDSNHAETGDCYSAKLHLTPEAGDYVLRFTTYQGVTGQFGVPTGSMAVSFSDEGWSPTPTTTTTTVPPTTTSTTTTTTTTTSTTTTTTEAPPSTTTQAPTTTTSTTTSTSTSTTTVPPTTTSTTTTTLAPTTTTSTTTTSTVPPTTSTTTVPVVVTTLPPTTTSTTTTTTSTTTTSTTTTVPPTTTTEPPPTTTVPPTTTTEPPRVTEALVVVADIVDEQLAEAIVDVIGVEPDEIKIEDVETMVEQESFADVSDQQLTAIAEVIDDAPDDVKQVFQDATEEDTFSGALDDFTRTDSEITNGERRTVIAVTAASTAALAMPRPTPPTSTAGPSAPSGPSGPTRRKTRR